jgi:signal transduction histidine kinase/PAS domain-containing protein
MLDAARCKKRGRLRLGLVAQVFVALAFVTTLVTGSFFFYSIREDSRELFKNAIELHRVIVNTSIPSLAKGVWDISRENVMVTVRSMFSYGEIKKIAIYLEDGQPYLGMQLAEKTLQQHEPVETASLPPLKEQLSAALRDITKFKGEKPILKEPFLHITPNKVDQLDHRFIVAMPYISMETDDKPIHVGFLVMDFQTNRAMAFIKAKQQQLFLLFCGLTLTILILLFVILRKMIIVPIMRLTDAAKQAADGVFNPVKLPRIRNEIGSLMKNFNTMLAKIELNTKNLKTLIRKGRDVSIQSTLQGIEQHLKAVPCELGFNDVKVKVYFHANCFMDNKLPRGFYILEEENKPDTAACHCEDDILNKHEHVIRVMDTHSDNCLALFSFHHMESEIIERMLPTFEAMSNNVASAINAFRLKKTLTILEVRTEEVQTIFNNINQGICLIDDKIAIGNDYSAALEAIVEERELGGRSLIELLDSRTTLGGDRMAQIKEVLSAVLNSHAVAFTLNAHALPQELEMANGGSKKFLEVDWTPIYSHQSIISRMMITFRDVTDIKQLRQIAERNRAEIDILCELSTVSPQSFHQMTESSLQYLQSNLKILKDEPTLQKNSMAVIKRNLHTIKGNCRTYNFSMITDTVHDVENLLADLSRALEHESKQQLCIASLLEGHAKIEKAINQYVGVYRNRFASAHEKAEEKSQILLDTAEVLSHLPKGGETVMHDPSLRQRLESIHHKIIKAEYPSLKKVVEGFGSFVKSLARELAIDPPTLSYEASKDWYFGPETAESLKSCFTHLIRNSMDHGFKNKEMDGGAIYVWAREGAHGNLIIEYFDNGYGVDLVEIRKKAVELHFIENESVDDLTACSLIFQSGFTTKDKVTALSGRGIGMDAVASFFKELGGRAELKLKEKVEAGRFSFHIQLELPLSHVVYVDKLDARVRKVA